MNERLGWTLIHFLWQGAAIMAFYGIARQWLVPSKPQPRYLLGVFARASMAVVPVFTIISASPIARVALPGASTVPMAPAWPSPQAGSIVISNSQSDVLN